MKLKNRTIDNSSAREPLSDEIHETGTIIKVEDGVYPLFVVTMEFPENDAIIDFDLNVEAVKIDAAELAEMTGKSASFYYTANDALVLEDLKFGNTSLFPERNPKKPIPNQEEWSTVTGILKGADSETSSDLPGTLVVTDKAGKIHAFPYYVDKLMTTGQDKEVTAYYTTRPKHVITFWEVEK